MNFRTWELFPCLPSGPLISPPPRRETLWTRLILKPTRSTQALQSGFSFKRASKFTNDARCGTNDVGGVDSSHASSPPKTRDSASPIISKQTIWSPLCSALPVSIAYICACLKNREASQNLYFQFCHCFHSSLGYLSKKSPGHHTGWYRYCSTRRQYSPHRWKKKKNKWAFFRIGRNEPCYSGAFKQNILRLAS